jgi:hypothetical protein
MLSHKAKMASHRTAVYACLWRSSSAYPSQDRSGFKLTHYPLATCWQLIVRDGCPVHTVHNALLGLYEYANSLPEDARRPMPANDGGVASDEYRHANVRKMADRAEDAGSGALFKNDKKEKPSHPDYRGDAMIKGRKFWVSGWIKTSEKGGQKFISLAFREAEEQQAKPKLKAPTNTDADILF